MSNLMFELDPRIEADSTFICELALCQLRIQNDQRYPWLVLIPQIPDATEVHELNESQQRQLMSESSLVASALKAVTGCKKINVANLGNVVAQLHWHIVARFETDATWPGPIWGVGTAQAYEEQQMADFIQKVKSELQVN